MKRVMTLYRVSSKKQYDKLVDDIPMQREECHAFAERQNWIIVKEFYEKGISGFKVSADKRDAVQDLRDAALNKEFDVLLVFMFDRIGRIDSETPFVVEWFASQGIEIWSTQEGQQKFENQTDKLVNYMRFWQANGESVKTSMRVKTIMAQLTSAGVYHGGVTPFGYRVFETGQKNKKGNPVRDIEINPAESPYVKMAFEKVAYEGYGTHRIEKLFKELGIKTHNGANFTHATIERMLRNRLYCGYYVSGDTVSPQIERLVIVDENLFKVVQEILEQRSKDFKAKRSMALSTVSSTLLSGNIVCGHCGAHLASSAHVERHVLKDGTVKERKEPRYVCYHRSRKLNDCDGQSAYLARKIDKEVLSVVKEYLKKIKSTPRDKAIELRYQNEVSEKKKLYNELMKVKEKLSNRLNELSIEVGKCLTGESRFSVDILSVSIESTKQELEKTEDDIRKCEADLENKKDTLSKLDFYYDQFLSWADEFSKASLEKRKMIICYLIDEIRIHKGYHLDIKFNLCYNQFINQ